MTLILALIALAASAASISMLWSVIRKIDRVDEDLTRLERAVFGIEGDIANLQQGRQP